MITIATILESILARNYKGPKKMLIVPGLCLVVLAGMTGSALAASEFWAGPGGTTNTPASGTWTTTTPTVWSDGTVNTPDVGWTAGSAAVFGGTDPQTVGITVGGAISASSLTFNNSGYTLSAATTQTITASGNPFLIAAAGTTNTVGSHVTINSSTASTDIIGASSGANAGTINILTGGSVTSSKGLMVSGAGTVVNVQGAMTTANVSAAILSVGGTAGDNATLVVNGGTVSIQKNTASIWIGTQSAAVTATEAGTLTITNGGAVTETGGFVSIAPGTGNVGTLNLNGGTLTTANINGGTGTGQSGLGTSTLNFNGGTLKAQSSPSPLSFIAGLTAINVRNGGAVINNNAFSLVISNALVHSAISGDAGTDGGLTSLGSGTLTLPGANTYNGPTVVSAGKLVTTTASTGGGSYTVADGAALEVQVNNPNTALTASSFSLGTSGASTLNFTLGNNASATTPAIQDNGALTVNGTVTVNITGTFNTTSSTNLLISYASGGSGTFSLGSIPAASGGGVATLINSGNQLMLIYSQPAQAVKWAVGSGNWDTTSLNWQPLGGGIATNYVETSPVTFDDTASGSSPIVVTLTGNRSPASITNNSTKNYTLTGGFNLSTSGNLDKSGSGTLTVAVNSSVAGGTAVHAGTLQVGTGGTAGSLGTGNIAVDGTVIFDRSDVVTIPGIVSGAGNLVNNGTGTVILTATNSYTGATTVNAGKLSLLAGSTGAGSFTVADGGTLEVQSVSSGSYLQMSGLNLGSSGQLTNNFLLGSGRITSFPLEYVVGDINLNGTVVINLNGTGLVAGTYVLLQYTGSLNGTGNFVAGGLPGQWTLVNDTVDKQLLITGTPGLVWDSGNTNNGAAIDPASGTWDLTATNLVWNSAGANVSFANGNNAIFAGTDGTYNIKVGAAVSPTSMMFMNSGYMLTNDTPQTVGLSTVSTAVPKILVASGKTATIGTNVTVNLSNTSFIGNAGNTPGGILDIENGGVVQELTANTWAVDGGAGTEVTIKTGGLMKDVGGSSGQVAIGATAGNSPLMSVDGGSLEIDGTGTALNVLIGTLTLNGGTVSMPAGTSKPVTVGSASGNAGTLNFNGGIFSAAEIIKGDPTGFATNNFNGGTLKAVNATFGTTFLTGLDCANVRNGGAIIDDGGFAISVGQPLVHSTIAGDNVVDGGFTKLGAGILSLTGAESYTGTTTVSNGTLQINGSILSNAVAAATGTLGGNGSIGGSVTIFAGAALAPGVGDTSTLTINGNLTLQGNYAAVVNKSVPQSNSLCFVNGTLSNSGTGAVTLTNSGTALVLGDTFKLFNKAVTGGGALTITSVPGPDLAWQNNLATDGSVSVVTGVASYPTNITVAVSGNALVLTWPSTHLGWIAQSNSVNLIDTNYWFDIPGSSAVTSLTNTFNLTATNVFYRLRHP